MHAPALPHSSVSIRVGQRNLREYKPELTTQTSTCYVEAVPGLEFGVKLKLHPGLRKTAG